MGQARSASINTTGAEVFVLAQSDASALYALLHSFDENEELFRKIAQDNQLGLGANHIESLSTLWKKLAFSR